MVPNDEGRRERVLEKLRLWLGAARPGLEASRITETTDIIEARILESVQVIEFILFLENETGRSILSEDMDMSALRTLASIYATFFETDGR